MITEAEHFLGIALQASQDSLASLMDVIGAAQCESPIERIMLAALYVRFRFKTPLAVSFHPQKVFEPFEDMPREQMIICSQVQIKKHRVDFLIWINLGCNLINCGIVIECDGHDFHERTKEQAARDRARDRELQSSGYLVLRFTGSEIWKSPVGCAEQVAQAIIAKINQIHTASSEKSRAEMAELKAMETPEERAALDAEKAEALAALERDQSPNDKQ